MHLHKKRLYPILCVDLLAIITAGLGAKKLENGGLMWYNMSEIFCCFTVAFSNSLPEAEVLKKGHSPHLRTATTYQCERI